MRNLLFDWFGIVLKGWGVVFWLYWLYNWGLLNGWYDDLI